jgi:hypothetical protein
MGSTRTFLRGVETIRALSPTAQVGCGFIASSSVDWKADNPRSGLTEEWSELFAASDFVSTNMMMDTREVENGDMARATRAAIAQLGQTGRPVHINHWVTWIVASQKPLVPANHHTQTALTWIYAQKNGLRFPVHRNRKRRRRLPHHGMARSMSA